jgi:hypothetical protein
LLSFRHAWHWTLVNLLSVYPAGATLVDGSCHVACETTGNC